MKKIAVLQSNYIPWKGYFDMINMVDEFILYDTVQYTKNDWRNRNKVKVPDGTMWLTIPVQQKSLDQLINNTYTLDNRWRKKHWNTLKTYYSKSPYFKEYSSIFEKIYLQSDEQNLSKINEQFILEINTFLNIKTTITRSEDYNLTGDKQDRLLQLCAKTNATEYLSGPAAKSYIDEDKFKEMGVKVSWMEYSGYKEYHQLHPPFEHGVSVLDLIFNEGLNAQQYLISNN